MTTDIADSRAGGRRRALPALIVAVVLVLGGCSTMVPFTSKKSTATTSVAPLSDDQSRAQVIDAARDIVRAANLQITYATFQWEWCNDQGEPPFHGRVDVAVKVPEGTDSAALAKQIAAAAARQPGWAPGPPAGLNPYGEVTHKGGVMAIAGPGNYPERASLRVLGECRNVNAHRDTTGQEITGELRGE